MPDRPRIKLPTNVLFSLRGRVWLLVALIAVPMLVESLVAYLGHRAEAIAHLEREFRQLSGAALLEQDYLVAHTRELLQVMAEETADLDAAKCTSLARNLLQIQRDYQNFGAVLPDGTLFCSGRPAAQPLNYSDSSWFREVVERKEMSRGHYALSRVTGRYGIVFAQPILDKAGALRAIVYANTSLAWLQRLAFAGKSRPGWDMIVMASDGKLVFQHQGDADAQARTFPNDAQIAMLQAGPANGLIEMPGLRGEPYLYGVAALDSTGGDFRLAIGVPKASVLNEVDRNLRNHLLLLALAGIVSIVVGRFAVHRSFGAWAERVHENLRRFSAGERDVRFTEDNSIPELREVDGALNALFDDIKAAGTALRETRQDLGLALECANLATWDWCLRDGSKSGNARLAEMLGYNGRELKCDSEKWKELVCPDDWTAVQAALQGHLDGSAPIYECEYRLRHRDGHWIWVLARGRVLEWDAEGHPARMAGTALDITSRKLTELELRQRTEELTALLDAIPAPVWIARDPACREIVGNRAANRLYDMPSGTNLSLSAPEGGQLLGFRYRRADGVEYATDELPMQRATAEARPIENSEIRMLLPDGRDIWLFGNAAPLFDDEGKVRGAVAAFVDITRLRSMDEALRRNEMVLAQAGKMARVGAWSIDIGDTDNLLANPAHWADELFRIFGYEPGEVEPTAALFMEHVHAEDRQRILEAAMQAMADRRSTSCEFRIIRHDGAERIVVDHGKFHYDRSGRPTHFIGACQDVTEQKEVERELVRHRNQLESLVAERTYELAVAKEAAERANRAKSQFLANISHELRTPLNSLMLLAHVLSDNAWGNLTPQQIEYARMIELSGNDLVHLIDELLDLAKIEAGRFDIDVKSVPFPDIMQNVHRIHRHVAQQKGLDFKMEIGADVPASILTDPLRLQQLLRNLLSNAIKFTYEGGVTLRIRRALSGWRYGNPALSHAETVIAFDVIDTGIGLTPEQQQQISESFEQSHKLQVREYGRTGLGLTISSEIAALLGGELAVTSVPSQGSTFTLFLPLSYLGPAKLKAPAVAAPAQPPAEEAEALPDADPILAGKTVLVVDDDQRNRFALTAMLEKQGMRVLSAPGGAEALELLARDDVDVVLMDIMMPVLDGYQTVRAIRGELGRGRLPVIALTADATSATREECLAAGCSDYLAKPVSNSDLLARMRKWLEEAVRT